MRCKNALFWTSVLTPGCISWKTGFVSFSNGACEATDEADFIIWGGQLVVRGMKHWYFERDNEDDDKNNWISTNRIDNSGRDDGGGDGGWGRGRGVPRAATAQTRAEDKENTDHRQRWAGVTSAGIGGIHTCGSGGERPPTMVGRPRAGACKTRPQTPYATTPRGGNLGPRGWQVLMMVGLPRVGIILTWPPPPPANLTP